MIDFTMRIKSARTRRGVKNLPTRSTILEGEAESQKAMAKKTARKIGSAMSANSAARNGRTAISKETVPVRGTAKHGPIAM